MNGEYVHIVPTDHHVCRPDTPPLNAGVGSIWRCKCGREFKLTQVHRNPDGEGDASYSWSPCSSHVAATVPTVSGWVEPSKWDQAGAEKPVVRWGIVTDPDLGVIASITVDGEVVSTAAAEAEWRP